MKHGPIDMKHGPIEACRWSVSFGSVSLLIVDEFITSGQTERGTHYWCVLALTSEGADIWQTRVQNVHAPSGKPVPLNAAILL